MNIKEIVVQISIGLLTNGIYNLIVVMLCSLA